MTQRDTAHTEGATNVGVYSTPSTTSTPASTTTSTPASTTTGRATPAKTITRDVIGTTESRDLIHWGSVIAGLFAALATLISLAVLGLAIGFSSFDANNITSSLGIGAGVWGALTALIAFLVGGWIAGRSTALQGRTSGIMNGAMLWFLAIPLLVYAVAGGIGALANTAGSVASTAVQAGATAAGSTGAAVANDPALQATAQAGAAGAVSAVQATAQAAIGSVSPQDVNNAAGTAASGAWGTLLSLGLTAAAAIGGGYLGSRRRDPVVTSSARSA